MFFDFSSNEIKHLRRIIAFLLGIIARQIATKGMLSTQHY